MTTRPRLRPVPGANGAPGPAVTPPQGNTELPRWVAEHVGLRELQHAVELAGYRDRIAQLESALESLAAGVDAG